MIESNPERRQASDGARPVRLYDPEADQTHVLVPADVYERMRAIIDGMTRRAGWDDPKMNDYEIYRRKT